MPIFLLWFSRRLAMWGCSLCNELDLYEKASGLSGQCHWRSRSRRSMEGNIRRSIASRRGTKRSFQNDTRNLVPLAKQQTAYTQDTSTSTDQSTLPPLLPQGADKTDNSTISMCPKLDCFEARLRQRDLAEHIKDVHEEINRCKSILGIAKTSVRSR